MSRPKQFLERQHSRVPQWMCPPAYRMASNWVYAEEKGLKLRATEEVDCPDCKAQMVEHEILNAHKRGRTPLELL